MTIQEFRSQFPILSREVYGKPLVYFDNAATIQRPRQVLDAWTDLSSRCNANLHRAVHYLAAEATQTYEDTRDTVRDYLHAEDRSEIVFTSGTTHSVNLVAFSFGEAFVRAGDEVIVSEAEHHSNIVPWQMMCQRKGATLKVLPVSEDGHLRVDLLEGLISDKTKILAVSHISNVLGLINPVAEIIRTCHAHGIPVLVDGAQGIVHEPVDVQALDCDFYVFSGHKMYAAPGTGVLYGKRKWLEQMPPYMGGGEMIGTVKFSRSTYAPLPQKFEAGTQNIAGTPTLKVAIDTLKQLQDKQLKEETEGVKAYLLDRIQSDSRLRLFGVPHGTDEKIGLFSFVAEGVHHEDLALILDKMGIAVRSGQMCAEPLMDRYGVTGMLRISLAPYNTMQEAKYFMKSLDRAINMLA